MRLYLVRHAESLVNAQKIHQSADTPLHERGFAQIDRVAARLAPVGIDAILASPYERTKVTAEHLAEHLGGVPITFMEDLREIRRPSEMQGKKTTDPDVLAIQAQIVAHYADPNYAYSDEETFNDLKARGGRVLDAVAALGKNKVLAVSHAAFIRVITACAMFGSDLAPREYQGLWSTFIDNAGVTILEHDAAFAPMHPWGSPWKIQTVNDAERLSS